MQQYVITLKGDDQPGILEKLTKIIDDHKGNWLDAHVAQLCGKVAGLVIVDIPQGETEFFEESIHHFPVGEVNLELTQVQPTEKDEHIVTRIGLISNDRPGIVRDISQHLSSLGIHINKLHSDCYPAPMSGGNIFAMQAEIVLPENCDEDNLRNSLEGIADDLLVEFTVTSH